MRIWSFTACDARCRPGGRDRLVVIGPGADPLRGCYNHEGGGDSIPQPSRDCRSGGAEFPRKTDPVLARLIDARSDFRPRAWLDELPPLDAFGTLVFQVAGQQLSVASTRAIVSHLRERFGGVSVAGRAPRG